MLVHLHLVEQLEVLLLDSVAQAGFQCRTCIDAGLHGCIKKQHGVAAFVFGAVQGHFDLLQHGGAGGRACAKQRNACAGGGIEPFLLVQVIGGGQALVYLLCQIVRTGRGLCGPGAYVGRQHGKGVAAHPCHGVLGLHGAADAPRHLAQQQVACGMAPGVVDLLEAVYVHQQQQAVAVCAAAHGLLQPFVQQGAVGQAGQCVVVSQLVYQGLGGLALRDVLFGGDKVGHGAVLVEDGADGGHLHVGAAVLARVDEFAAPGLAAAQGGPHGFVGGGWGQALVEDARVLAQHLGLRVAGGAHKSIVHVLDAGRGVGDDDGFGALLHRCGEAAQVCIAPLQLGGHVVDASLYGVQLLHGREALYARLQAPRGHAVDGRCDLACPALDQAPDVETGRQHRCQRNTRQQQQAPPEALVDAGHRALQRGANGHQQGCAGQARCAYAVHAPVAIEAVEFAYPLACL